MSTYSDAEWILSRKIVVKSLTRHFAPWKSRFFVLDRANAVLGIRSSLTTGVVVVPLSEPSLSIQRHEYGAEAQNLLTIKYKEADSSAIKEVVMKFDTPDHLLYWEKSLQSVTENVRSVTTSSTLALFQTFIEYVNEQSQLQSIVDSESQFEGGYYNGTTAAESQTNARLTDTPNSLDGSFTEPSAAGTMYNPTGLGQKESPFGDALPTHSPILSSMVQMRPLRVPRMHVLLIAVGTRGDMQPFVQLGARLQRDGHRVRLATHACFRDFVVGKGLEFYPLAGDPLKLSEFMVKTQGFVIPTTPELLMEAPIYHRMVVDMMYSCWGACVDPDPLDPAARKFVADAIISNPVSYAHAHCAEALGIPLHLMFPQPWTPTKAFPHPLSCLSYQQGWSSENYISYQLVDTMLWMSFERHINAFRVNVLGLEPLRVGDGGWNHLNIMKVPFVKMWSPSFVPKPKDWPSYVDVAGTFFDTTVAFTPRLAALKPGKSGADSLPPLSVAITAGTAPTAATTKSSATSAGAGLKEMAPVVENQFKPPENLVRFLEGGDTPVFVGFGSMVVKNLEALISMFLEGAALAGVRIIVQLGWSEITPARFLELALQAQLKASVVRETEQLNDHMFSSLIFPSGRPAASKPSTTTTIEMVRTTAPGAVDLTMSVRSVESTSTVEEESRDDSTLDGENLASSNNMYTSSLSASLHPSVRRTVEDNDFDVSPISTPERRRSDDHRERPTSTGVAGTGSGLGKWLFGAAATLSKSLQSSNPTTSSKPASEVPTPSSARLSGNSMADDWDEVSADGWSAAKDALFIGPCPHDWLFQRVAGVVHHGGAGTTAAGLRFGCPTWICPFFGDQHFWGEMVHRREVGPKPCPVGALTVEIIADSLSTLQGSKIIANAAALAESMSHEDGVEGACQAFYKHLPLESMLCDVSLFRGEYRLAQIFCQDCGLKMCSEVSQHLHTAPSLHMQDHRLGPCTYKNWTRPAPRSAGAGLLQGLGGLVYELREGVSDLVYDPVHGIYSQGISGGAAGLSTGLQSLLSRPLAGGSVLLNKVKEGIRASLASNLHYGVATSSFDPLTDASSAAEYEMEMHPGADSPHTPHTSKHIQHRGLKLTIEELPAVVEASLIDEHADGNFSPPQSPVKLASSGLQSGGRSSPRGLRVASEDHHDPSGLAASQRSVASNDSTAFYAKKIDSQSAAAGDHDSGGDDESVYGDDDAVPFLLYSSGHEDHAVKPLSPVALGTGRIESSLSGKSTSAAEVSRGIAPLAGLQEPSATLQKASNNAKDSLSSQVNHSSGSSPADTHAPARVAAVEHTPTIEDTFATAQAARRLFSDLGAKSGRLMASVEFAKLMQRALHRDTAMQATVDPADSYDALDEEAPRGSASAGAGAGAGVGGAAQDGLSERSLSALIQMVAHGKSYVDFVDFSLIYLELQAHQQHLHQHQQRTVPASAAPSLR